MSLRELAIKMKYSNPPESAMGLWYDPQINRFIDDGGYILHDLHQYFDLWQLDEWKKTREYGILTDRNGDLWELYYSETDCDHACEKNCDHGCDLCGSKCEVYAYLRDWRQEQNYIQTRKEIFG